MLSRCPYIKLAIDQSRVSHQADIRHRCYLDRPPQRIGSAFQESTCLTPAFHACPRLAARPPLARPVPAPRLGELTPVEPPPSRWPSRPPRPPAPLSPSTAAPTQAGERQKLLPLSLIEFLTLTMTVAFLLACLFVGYAIFYRIRVGPGMLAPVAVVAVEATATAAPTPTLIPTYTPTPLPTATRPAPTALPTGTPTPLPTPTPTPTPDPRPPADSPPTRLAIPNIGVDIPIVTVGTKSIQDGGKTRLVWDDVPNAGAFHGTSAYPGNVGNTVINGHRDIQGSVFRRLDQLEAGDEILLYVGETPYPYAVSETMVVPEAFATAEQRAENLRLIGHQPEERLTLITCTPIGLATHRLLVIAEPAGPIQPQLPEAGSEETP